MTTHLRSTIFALIFVFCASGLYAQSVQGEVSSPTSATAEDMKKVTQALQGLTRTQQAIADELGKNLERNTETLINAGREAAEIAANKSAVRAELLLNQRLREEAIQRENAERRSRNIMLGSAAFSIIAVLCIAMFGGYWTKKLIASFEKRAMVFTHSTLRRNDRHTEAQLAAVATRLIDKYTENLSEVVQVSTESALRKMEGIIPPPDTELAIKDGTHKVFDTPIQPRIHIEDKPATHEFLVMALLDNDAWNKRWREEKSVEVPVTITVTERTPGVKGSFPFTAHLTADEETSYAIFEGDADARKIALRNTLKNAIRLAKENARTKFSQQEVGHRVM